MTAEAPPAVAVGKSQDSAPVSGVRAWLSRHPLAAYAIRRFGLYLVELWGALTIAFFFFRMMPGDPIQTLIQTGYPSYFNTAFWKDWPTDDNLYEVPLNWWPHFIFVLAKISATGQKGPS